MASELESELRLSRETESEMKTEVVPEPEQHQNFVCSEALPRRVSLTKLNSQLRANAVAIFPFI